MRQLDAPHEALTGADASALTGVIPHSRAH